MNPAVHDACNQLLVRLGAQIDAHLPVLNTYGEAAEKVPLERLPAIADVVRTFVETQVVLSQAAAVTTQTDDCQSN